MGEGQKQQKPLPIFVQKTYGKDLGCAAMTPFMGTYNESSEKP
jgi:hypothetical protein